jgi:hypothetical protein
MRHTRSAPEFGALALLASLTACDINEPPSDLIQQPGEFRDCTDPPEEQEVLFQEVWTVLDATYPYFDYKEIDWLALHDKCRELVCEERHDYDDFIGPAADCLLAPLADEHVGLTDPEGEFHGYGVEGYTPNSLDSLANERLDYATLVEGPTSVTGTLNGGRFGYIRVDSFSVGLEDFGSRVAAVGVVEGWVIDMRQNGGGNELAAMELAGQFVEDTTTPYSYVQYREETDGDPTTHELGPQTARTLDADLVADEVFVGNVALLIGDGCVSSCESFVAMMDLAESLRTFGDTTRGSSGNPEEIVLEADGVTRLLSSTWFDTLGDGTTVIEWNGIDPDEPVDFEGGEEDQILEAAILWVAGG